MRVSLALDRSNLPQLESLLKRHVMVRWLAVGLANPNPNPNPSPSLNPNPNPNPNPHPHP